MNRRNLIGLCVLAGGSIIGGCAIENSFKADLAHAQARVGQGSVLAGTRFGPIEYAIAGDGPPLLMIHGTGGGFDQGLAFAARLITAGYRVIAPSRFGYLRSAMPEDPSSRNQADAFADLLDHLQVTQLQSSADPPARFPRLSLRRDIRHGARLFFRLCRRRSFPVAPRLRSRRRLPRS